MKKLILIFGAFILLCSVSSANDDKNNTKDFDSNVYRPENKCQKEIKKDDSQNSCTEEKSASKQEIEDDEYCTYNQCFFDKRYRKMKKALCLSEKQEFCLDNYYQNFKTSMENNYLNYQNHKNNILEALECDKNCYKKEVLTLKEIKKDTKEKVKDFRDEINDLLCKNQRKAFKKFYRKERRKMKKITKYASIYKFPCVNCNKKN